MRGIESSVWCLSARGIWVNYSTEEGNLRKDDGIPVLSVKIKIGSVRSESGHIQQSICSHDSET